MIYMIEVMEMIDMIKMIDEWWLMLIDDGYIWWLRRLAIDDFKSVEMESLSLCRPTGSTGSSYLTTLLEVESHLKKIQNTCNCCICCRCDGRNEEENVREVRSKNTVPTAFSYLCKYLRWGRIRDDKTGKNRTAPGKTESYTDALHLNKQKL